MSKKALIAMSGGVDSSVAACLMKERGYECAGATIKTHEKDSACCSEKDIEDARYVAEQLNMPYYLYNFTGQFEDKVIKNFIHAYENGYTPNPCIECNKHIKFQELYKRAEELGYEKVVTGHYARVCFDEKSGRYLLKKGLDPNKDQSYVLCGLTQEQLSHTIFPLGEYTKPEVRELAQKYSLVTADKHDSQDICFISSGKYGDFIRNYTHKDYPEGDFVNRNGEVLGRHKGIINYTIGQRKGLGLSLKAPLYVCKIDVEKNQVVLDEEAGLYSSELIADNLNLISVPAIDGKMRIKAKVRYRHEEQDAFVSQIDEDTVKIVFDKPQRAITKGQSVVMYDGDSVVGGAVIVKC